MSDPLADAFLRALLPAARAQPLPADLSTRLGALVARASAAWPGVALTPADFVAHLAARLSGFGELLTALDEVEAVDLWLALGCARGDALALARFDEQVLPKVDVVVARLNPSGAFLDEVRQALRERLLVARAGAPPRVAEYAGQGPLVSWVRAAAMRVALNLRRPHRRDEALEDEALEALPLAGPDPELMVLRARHREAFHRAFQHALAALSTRERTALKLQALDGVSLERIGEIYGVNKSTVSRWLTRVHETLVAETRGYLARELSLPSQELESLMRAMRSQLDISLAGLLD